MIVDKSFTKEWIQTQRTANQGADPGFIEKQIYAFALLHLLATTGKEFVFKGGTSLHLILPDHKRLSTDLDVVGELTFGDHAKMIMKSRFIRVEENVRKKKNIPKRHFKFFYTSAMMDVKVTFCLIRWKSNTPNGFAGSKHTEIYGFFLIIIYCKFVE